jgi:hypothetical protein
MIRNERQGECAGLDPANVYRDEPEAGASYRIQHLRAERIADRADQICGRQLDPRDVVVVPNSQLVESELPQGRLSALDLAELDGRDRLVVRNPRREARRSRFVGHLQAHGPGKRAHCQLGHPSVGEWSQHIVVRGGTGTWSIGSPSIIGVLAVRNGVQAISVGDLIVDAAEELVFAMKTPIRPVRLILRAITFEGHHFDEPYADLACDVVSSTPLIGSEARGHPEQSYHAVDSKDPRREGKQERRVDAT